MTNLAHLSYVEVGGSKIQSEEIPVNLEYPPFAIYFTNKGINMGIFDFFKKRKKLKKLPLRKQIKDSLAILESEIPELSLTHEDKAIILLKLRQINQGLDIILHNPSKQYISTLNAEQIYEKCNNILSIIIDLEKSQKNNFGRNVVKIAKMVQKILQKRGFQSVYIKMTVKVE
jgi:hypothetical protein